VWGAKAGVTQW